jgi:hypothetical protein
LAFFQELNSSIFLIRDMLLANQNLCKLLYYNERDPLSQPTISNTKVLDMENLFPMPKMPDIETKKQSILDYYFNISEPWTENPFFRKTYLTFDIIIHLDLWLIKDALRPYSILNEIDEMFNNKYINDLSGKNIYANDAKVLKYSDMFYGYHMIYDLTNTSGIGGT